MKKITAYKTNKPSAKQTAALIAQLKLFNFAWWLAVIDSLWQQRVVRYFFAAATATVDRGWKGGRAACVSDGAVRARLSSAGADGN